MHISKILNGAIIIHKTCNARSENALEKMDRLTDI